MPPHSGLPKFLADASRQFQSDPQLKIVPRNGDVFTDLAWTRSCSKDDTWTRSRQTVQVPINLSDTRCRKLGTARHAGWLSRPLPGALRKGDRFGEIRSSQHLDVEKAQCRNLRSDRSRHKLAITKQMSLLLPDM